MPPKTRPQKEEIIRSLLKRQIAYIGRADVIDILDMNEKSMQMWELENAGDFPIECYFLVNGPFKTIIYPLVSVLEYVSGTARAMRILEEEGLNTNG